GVRVAGIGADLAPSIAAGEAGGSARFAAAERFLAADDFSAVSAPARTFCATERFECQACRRSRAISSRLRPVVTLAGASSKPPYSSGWSSTWIASRLSCGSRLGPLGYRPAQQHAAELEPEVVMQAARSVLLDHERQRLRLAVDDPPARLGGQAEVALFTVA